MTKRKKHKLPKRIAGVKIPKILRKSGNSLIRLAETPAGREILAEALVAIAGGLLGGRYIREHMAESDRDAAHIGPSGAVIGKEIARSAAEAVARAIERVLPSVFGTRDEQALAAEPASAETQDSGNHGRNDSGEAGGAAAPLPDPSPAPGKRSRTELGHRKH